MTNIRDMATGSNLLQAHTGGVRVRLDMRSSLPYMAPAHPSRSCRCVQPTQLGRRRTTKDASYRSDVCQRPIPHDGLAGGSCRKASVQGCGHKWTIAFLEPVVLALWRRCWRTTMCGDGCRRTRERVVSALGCCSAVESVAADKGASLSAVIGVLGLTEPRRTQQRNSGTWSF